MPAKFPTGRRAPEKIMASAEISLPGDLAGNAPANTLSGAFAAALGTRPQMSHPGSDSPRGQNSRKLAEETGAPRINNTRPGAPIVPRKGHR